MLLLETIVEVTIRSTLVFLLPPTYSRLGAYVGGDPGLSSPVVFCKQAFLAAPGFDAVSGLGSPYYPSMKEFILSLP
jgi:hypothetical protein